MKKKEPKTLGERIRHVRGDLTQLEFSEIVRIKQAMVSRYEVDHEIPSPRVLLKISRFCGRSIEWLLTGEEAKVRRYLTTAELINQAATCLGKTQLPDAKEFSEMMKYLFKNRQHLQKVIEHYRFIKSRK